MFGWLNSKSNPPFWPPESKKNKYQLDLSTLDLKAFYPKAFNMWIALFFAYCIFCTNWLIFSKLKGSEGKGWGGKYSEIASGAAADSVNYAITIARGIFTIPASYILLKLGFRKACLMACTLTTLSLPLIFSPNWVILILGRLIMAAGGTLTIIYISPLLSKLVLPEKKKKLAALNGFTFALSGLIVNLLFIFSKISDFLVENWKWTASVTALLSFFPLIFFYIHGKNFQLISLQEKLSLEKKENYSTLLREKEAWIWIFAYSSLLVVSVLFSSLVPKILQDQIQVIQDSEKKNLVDWKSLYTVVFFSGTCFGLYFLGKLNLTRIQRTSIVKCATLATFSIWIIMALFAGLLNFFGGNDIVFWLTNVIIFIGAFFLSFLGLGIQSVLLYIPLEYRDYSAQKTATFFSCLWGIGYIILTFYYVLASILKEHLGGVISLFFLTGLILLFYIFACRLRESRPEYLDLTKFLKLKNTSIYRTFFKKNNKLRIKEF